MRKGLYVAAVVPDCLELRTRALALVVPPTAVVTDETAAWLFGADTLPAGGHLDVPAVSMFQLAGNNRLRNELCSSGERALTSGDIMVLNGVQVTTPIRTAWDLGRLKNRDRAMAALDALLRLAAFEKEDLMAGVERFRGQRGVVQLRELAPLADARAQSPAESVLRLRWLDGPNLPAPTPQVPVLDQRGNEVFHMDLGVPELKFAAEYDGEQWHSSIPDKAYDASRRVWSERQGWTIRVFFKENVFGANQNVWVILQDGVTEARKKLGRYHP